MTYDPNDWRSLPEWRERLSQAGYILVCVVVYGGLLALALWAVGVL